VIGKQLAHYVSWLALAVRDGDVSSSGHRLDRESRSNFLVRTFPHRPIVSRCFDAKPERGRSTESSQHRTHSTREEAEG